MNWFRTKFFHSCITLTKALKSNNSVARINNGAANFSDIGKYTATSLQDACKVCTDSGKSRNMKAVPPPPKPSHKSGTWRNLSFFVAFPSVILVAAFVILSHMHQEHKEKAPYADYEYMYKRAKRFPWGQGEKSFFHNPKVNNLPSDKPDPPEDTKNKK